MKFESELPPNIRIQSFISIRGSGWHGRISILSQ